MEYLADFIYNVLTGLSVASLIWFLILRPILSFPYKQWDRKMENPPPPPDRKSFKERLSEKQKEDISILRNYVNYGYQPTNKVDTSNPPKETGT